MGILYVDDDHDTARLVQLYENIEILPGPEKYNINN
jgi:hypothetical protein